MISMDILYDFSSRNIALASLSLYIVNMDNRISRLNRFHRYAPFMLATNEARKQIFTVTSYDNMENQFSIFKNSCTRTACLSVHLIRCSVVHTQKPHIHCFMLANSYTKHYIHLNMNGFWLQEKHQIGTRIKSHFSV